MREQWIGHRKWKGEGRGTERDGRGYGIEKGKGLKVKGIFWGIA